MRTSFRYLLALLLLAPAAAAQTTDALWQSLMEGNRTFVAGRLTFDNLGDLRRQSAPHQNPPVTVLSCSDSRVPPELVFNRSLDQLFVVRVAGNVASAFESSAAYLLAHNQVNRDAVQSGRVGMVTAYYNLSSGSIERIR